MISRLVSEDNNIFIKKPINLSLPDIPSPTSFHLTKHYYHSSRGILKNIGSLLGKKLSFPKIIEKHDVPDPDFRGPF